MSSAAATPPAEPRRSKRLQGKSTAAPPPKSALLKLPGPQPVVVRRAILKLPSPQPVVVRRVILKLPAPVTDAKLVSEAASELTGGDKLRLNKSTKAPHPEIGLLKPHIPKQKLCSNQQGYRWERHVNHHVDYWKENVPVYRLKGVFLEDLAARKKNDAKEMAQATMDAMSSWESDGASGLFQDEKGNPLVAYFAQRLAAQDRHPQGTVYYQPGPNTPSTMRRSPADFDQAKLNGEKVYFDGLNSKLLNKALVSTQLLIHRLGVSKSDRDGRHDKADFLMRYAKDGSSLGGVPALSDDRKSFSFKGIEHVYQDEHFKSESTGVVHLVHAWPDQGHSAEKHGIHPSADMLGGCHGSHFVHKYFEATEELASFLGSMLQASFPEFYLKYEAAFKAGKWTVVDPGPLLGRVVVWKLDVLPHQDGLDEGPAVIFPMGHFYGGECYIPDLRLKFSYRPGEVIILMAGALYHAIGKWAPLEGTFPHGITPGRVGNVFFFPHKSYEVLKDKPAGWAFKTAGGLLN